MRSVPNWIPWCVAGSLIGLWLLVPHFSLPLGFSLPNGPASLRHSDLVRWIALLIGLGVVPRAFHRLHWIDLPILIFCLSPFLAGWFNGQDLSSSTWHSAKDFFYWGVPYLLGRAIFTDEPSRKVLGFVVLVGAMLYIPASLYEIFNGPVLAKMVTGQEFGRMLLGANRGSTFRPSVFLSSGFVLTMFYVLAVFVAAHRTHSSFRNWYEPSRNNSVDNQHRYIWLWKSLGTAMLMVLVVLCKSLGSIILMGVGSLITVVLPSRVAGVALAMLCLAPPIYIAVRTCGMASTQRVHAASKLITSDEKAGSLYYRLRAEDLVFEQMSDHWWWGYGTWDGWSKGGNGMILDGFWLCLLTRTGTISLVAWLLMVSLPIIFIAWCAAKQGTNVTESAGFPFALFLALAVVDSMFNYFGEAPVMLCVGVVTTWALSLKLSGDRESLE